MALSPYQAPPFRTMDDAQHIPTSAQHGAKHTMANVALTQQMSVSDTTTVAGKFRALYMAMVQSKPSNDSTHTPPSSNRGHKLLLHAYTLIFQRRARNTQTIYSEILVYHQGQTKHLPTHHSISWRLAGTIQVQQVIWASPYTNIFGATRGLHNNVQRESRVQPRDRK
jgi:hypothetical protein